MCWVKVKDKDRYNTFLSLLEGGAKDYEINSRYTK